MVGSKINIELTELYFTTFTNKQPTRALKSDQQIWGHTIPAMRIRYENRYNCYVVHLNIITVRRQIMNQYWHADVN